MGPVAPEPPRSWLDLVRWGIAPERREEVVGDLLELWRARAPQGRVSTWLAFWRHAVSAGIVLRRRRSMPSPREAVSQMWLDGRDVLRGFRTGRSTLVVSWLILTLAMAAGTVTYSVVDALVFRALPVSNPDRLIAISSVSQFTGVPGFDTPQDYFAMRDGLGTLAPIGASCYGPRLRLQVENGTEELVTARTTASLFDVLGVPPVIGRTFQAQDEIPGDDDVAILSHDVWVRRFGGDPTIVGRRVTFADRPRAVIGVMPARFAYPISSSGAADVFIPYIPTADERSFASNGRASRMLIVGRLVQTATLAQVRANVDRVSALIAVQFPAAPEAHNHLVVWSLPDEVVGPAKTWLLLAIAAVALVLVTATVNVANLLLARATVRIRELATRVALGASRARLARVLLTEGLVLAVAAATAAVLLSVWGIPLVKAQLPAGLARASSIGLNLRVLTAAVTAAVLSGVALSSIPAWIASRRDLFDLLRSGGAVIGGRRRYLSHSVFLVMQFAFVSTLLVPTALAVTTFVLVTTADMGFDRHNVITIPVSKSLRVVADADRPAMASVFHADVMARAVAVPGVERVAMIENGAPLSGNSARYSIVVPGYGTTTGENMLETKFVTANYFATMGLRIVRGRGFDATDRRGSPVVALIDEAAAVRFFGSRDPVGQVIGFRGPTTIVGVVHSVRFDGPETDLRPTLYVPLDQDTIAFPSVNEYLIVRTASAPAKTAALVAAAIKPAIDGPGIAPQLMDTAFDRVTAARRFNASLLGIFGLVALGIAAIGVYGTMAFLVAQQVRATGLRMALGASPGRIMRTVLGVATRHVLGGVAAGLAGAWAASRLFTALVFGVNAADPRVYCLVAGILGAVAMIAALLPAIRAARLDPVVALRAE